MKFNASRDIYLNRNMQGSGKMGLNGMNGDKHRKFVFL